MPKNEIIFTPIDQSAVMKFKLVLWALGLCNKDEIPQAWRDYEEWVGVRRL